MKRVGHNGLKDVFYCTRADPLTLSAFPTECALISVAKIEDLIAQIPDERLKRAISTEVRELKKNKKFGLVFEEHLPETVRLPKLPVKEGEIVALKREPGNLLWRVKTIAKKMAKCQRAIEGYGDPKDKDHEFPVSDLVVVRSFGDPIYPALTSVDRVVRGGPDKPWHMVINAENFHANSHDSGVVREGTRDRRRSRNQPKNPAEHHSAMEPAAADGGASRLDLPPA